MLLTPENIIKHATKDSELYDPTKTQQYLDAVSVRNLTLTVHEFDSKLDSQVIRFRLLTFDISSDNLDLSQELHCDQTFDKWFFHGLTVTEFYRWVHMIYASMLLHESIELFNVKSQQFFDPHCVSSKKQKPHQPNMLTYFQDDRSCSTKSLV